MPILTVDYGVLEQVDLNGCKAVEIPSSVYAIATGAFAYCVDMESVTIPNSVTSIGDRAFRGCSGLTSVIIPNSVTTIGDSVFEDCSGLMSVTMPDSVTSIGDHAFRGCSSLTSLTIPNSVTSVGACAFYGCSGLTNVVIPKRVTNIGRYAFMRCSDLTNVIIDGNAPSEVGDNVFYEVSESCVIHVKTGTTGWDDDGDGKWMGMQIEYYGNSGPTIDGDEGAEVTGDEDAGFVIKPSEGVKVVEVTIPEGVEPEKVTVQVEVGATQVKANGAKVQVMTEKEGHKYDIAEFLDLMADESGYINPSTAEVKSEVVAEAIQGEGAEVTIGVEEPVITTAATKPGLTYTFRQGTTLERMQAGADAQAVTKVGDGEQWSPDITVKDPDSAFYSIEVTK